MGMSGVRRIRGREAVVTPMALEPLLASKMSPSARRLTCVGLVSRRGQPPAEVAIRQARRVVRFQAQQVEKFIEENTR